MPSIPSMCINLGVVSSQVEILIVEEENVQKQAYLLIEAVWEGGVHHNEILRDEKVQKMVTSPSNSQDQ